MSYYTGNKLNRKIEQFNLSALSELIEKVGNGEAVWPGTCTITPANPEDLEQLRILVYSILHSAGMKPIFEVRLVVGQLRLDMKTNLNKQVGVKFSPGAGLENTEPLGDEGLLDLVTK